MKTIKFLNLLLIPLFGMISFAACSSDDDDPEQGSDDPKPEELKLKTFEENVNGVAFTMIAVPGGSFNMGTDEDIKLGSLNNDDEKPAHKVTLDSYYIGETEVTQALWQAVMGSNPSSFKGAQRPVENVTYKQCVQFTEKLSKLTGKAYTLPTEAQWEYAARGGQKSKGYLYSGSNSLRGFWYYETTKEYDPENPYLTHVGEHQEVKLLWGNELGIHDMSGNVGEWCSDFYAPYTSSPQVNPKGENPYYGNVRVYRGGSFEYDPFHCRITCRFYSNEDWYKENGYPEYSFNNLGLRLALPQNYK